MKDGPLVWQDAADNVASVHRIGDQAAVEAAWPMPRMLAGLILMFLVAACALEMRSSVLTLMKTAKLLDYECPKPLCGAWRTGPAFWT